LIHSGREVRDLAWRLMVCGIAGAACLRAVVGTGAVLLPQLWDCLPGVRLGQDKHADRTFIGQNRAGRSPSSVHHSRLDDEREEDEAGESDEGQRYKKCFHDLHSK
jgi:hypothetical protein